MRGLAFAENHSLAADKIFVSSGGDKKLQIWSTNGLKAQLARHREENNTISLYKNYTP